MAITALRLAAVVDYISKYDPDREENPDNATHFKLGTLDSRIFGHIKDKTTRFSVNTAAPNDDAETSVQMNLVAYETVMYGLRGFTNLRDDEGNDIAFSTTKKNVAGKTYEAVAQSIMERIPSDVISELAEKINSLNEASNLGNG